MTVLACWQDAPVKNPEAWATLAQADAHPNGGAKEGANWEGKEEDDEDGDGEDNEDDELWAQFQSQEEADAKKV